MDYLLVKHIHVTAAIITTVLMISRLGLDVAGLRWRHTPLRWIPHVNDAILLFAGIGLVVVGGWNPFAQQWLLAKIILLVVYIGLGKRALDLNRSRAVRIATAVLALVVLTCIFLLANFKPF